MKASSAPKGLALVLSTVLGSGNLFVARAESQFWEQRRRSRQDRSSVPSPARELLAWGDALGTGDRVTHSMSDLCLERSLPASLVSAVPTEFVKRNQKLLAALSPEFGVIRNVALPKGSVAGVVVHIQDAHGNLEAQQNIGRMVESLVRSGQTGAVGLEGSWEELNFAWFQNHPKPAYVKAAADFQLKKNRITGPAYAAMTHAGSGGVPFVGVDDPVHYPANVEAYRRSAPRVDYEKTAWRERGVRLRRERETLFHPDLLALDRLVESYHGGRTPLADYVRGMALLVNVGPMVKQFLDAAERETQLDFKRVEKERSLLVEKLSTVLSETEKKELADHGLACRLGKIGQGDFHRYLEKICSRNGVPLSGYPAMSAYIRYVLSADAVNADALLDEISMLERAAYDRLAKTTSEKEMVQKTRIHWLTGKLLDFSMTREEWEEYERLRRASGALLGLETFEAFFREAFVRDQALAERTVRLAGMHGKSTALVTGGFHAAGVEKRLTDLGYAVIGVMPKLTSVETTSGSVYLSLFLQEKTPIDRLVEGKKLFLGIPPASFAAQVETAMIETGAQAAGEEVPVTTKMGEVDLKAEPTGDKQAEVTGVIPGKTPVELFVTGDGEKKEFRVESVSGYAPQGHASVFSHLKSKWRVLLQAAIRGAKAARMERFVPSSERRWPVLEAVGLTILVSLMGMEPTFGRNVVVAVLVGALVWVAPKIPPHGILSLQVFGREFQGDRNVFSDSWNPEILSMPRHNVSTQVTVLDHEVVAWNRDGFYGRLMDPLEMGSLEEDSPSWALLYTVGSEPVAINLSPDRVVMVGSRLSVWDSRYGEVTGQPTEYNLPEEGGGRASPQVVVMGGRYVFLNRSGHVFSAPIEGRGNTKQWDPLLNYPFDVLRLVSSPEGKSLMGVGPDNMGWMWRSIGDQLSSAAHSFNLPNSNARSGGYSPISDAFLTDQQVIVLTDGHVFVGDNADPVRFSLLPTKNGGGVARLALSTDHRALAAVSLDDRLRLWRSRQGRFEGVPEVVSLPRGSGHEHEEDSPVVDVVVTHQQVIVLFENGDCYARNLDSVDETHPWLKLPSQNIGTAESLAVSPDQHTLVVTGSEGKLEVYHAKKERGFGLPSLMATLALLAFFGAVGVVVYPYIPSLLTHIGSANFFSVGSWPVLSLESLVQGHHGFLGEAGLGLLSVLGISLSKQEEVEENKIFAIGQDMRRAYDHPARPVDWDAHLSKTIPAADSLHLNGLNNSFVQVIQEVVKRTQEGAEASSLKEKFKAGFLEGLERNGFTITFGNAMNFALHPFQWGMNEETLLAVARSELKSILQTAKETNQIVHVPLLLLTKKDVERYSSLLNSLSAEEKGRIRVQILADKGSALSVTLRAKLSGLGINAEVTKMTGWLVGDNEINAKVVNEALLKFRASQTPEVQQAFSDVPILGMPIGSYFNGDSLREAGSQSLVVLAYKFYFTLLSAKMNEELRRFAELLVQA